MTKYMLGVEDDGSHSMLTYSDMKRSFYCLKSLCDSFGAVILKSVDVDFSMNSVPECVDGSDVKALMKAGAHVIWFHQDYPESSPPTAQSVCRIEVEISQVQVERSRVVSADGSECLPTPPPPPFHAGDCHPVKPFPGSSSSTSSSTVEGGDEDQDAFGDTVSQALRILVLGNVDAGKSTIVGSLTTQSLDDGRGSCRLQIMKHRHEITTGRTSTVSNHHMGFDDEGNVRSQNGSKVRRMTEEELVRGSSRLITFTDLCGHEKYLKTTVGGVSASMGDYALMVCNSRHPPTHMTHHHLNLCASTLVPCVIVLTKIDGCPPDQLKNTIDEVKAMCRQGDVNKVPFMVNSTSDLDECFDKMSRLCPIILTSAVTGEGMDLLKYLLFNLPKRRKHEKKLGRPFEFLVDEIFNVPGVGPVASGFVNAGRVEVGDTVFVGPLDDGTFVQTMVKSAHIARTPSNSLKAGQSASMCMSLNKNERKFLRKGMVILKENPKRSCVSFVSEICVMKGDHTTIRRNYQAFVHILNVRQTATAKKIEMFDPHEKTNKVIQTKNLSSDREAASEGGDLILRPGCRAMVLFEFGKRPEYIRPGMRMLFRDGRVRGVGIIKTIVETKGAAVAT
ncbi:hypothetical protein TrCOL_g343 [Triparma columacea]|nr:hypothetical protein TrCOL_g343 [Triparma columacea]